MKIALSAAILLIALAASFYLGFVVARSSSNPSTLGFRDGYEEDQATAAFESFVQAWRDFLRENDGWIPADPYRALIEAGKVESYASFYCTKFVSPLPPRLNPDFTKNPKRVVLAWDRYDLNEVWTCYADGTWAKRSFSKSSADDYDWHTVIADAGYPTWKSLREKDAWIAEHRTSIIWDAQRRLYVPTTRPVGSNAPTAHP